MPGATVARTSAADLIRQGMSHHREGRLGEAERCYRAALRRHPDHAEGLHLLGILAGQAGRFPAALDLLRRAAAQAPDNADLYNNLGETLRNLGRFAEARDAYRRAVALNRDLAQAYENAAAAAAAEADLAEKSGRREIARELRRLAAADLVKFGQGCWRKMLVSKAEAAFRRALAADPRNAEAMNDLGLLLHVTGRLGEAKSVLERAAAIDPTFAAAFVNLANVRSDRGDGAGAERAHRKALALASSPEQTLQIEAGRLYRLMFGEESPEAIFAAHRDWGVKHMASLRAQGRDGAPSFANRRDPDRPLRLGYLSPDFREHSVSYYVEPLLAAHDRAAFEVFCYAEVSLADEMTRRLQQLAAHWRFVAGMDDRALQRQIRADGIDILIELAGHTGNSRLAALAPKPAPVTVSWLGYPATTGLPTVDYRITDAVADPPGEADRLHTERLVRLPGGFLCYRPPAEAPPVVAPPCRERGWITFGSFNNLLKVNESVVAAWAGVLTAVPGSRLLLKGTLLADEGVRRHCLDLFAQRGAAADRIEFLPRIAAMAKHLGAYGKVDIGLDPFPYNGTTTTCEALWMGVPVVTLRGDRHSGRVGASLLSRVGLEDLVAEDLEDYGARAVQLAADPDRIGALRTGLRERLRASPLCAEAGFARQFEGALREMWRRWCAGDAAEQAGAGC